MVPAAEAAVTAPAFRCKETDAATSPAPVRKRGMDMKTWRPNRHYANPSREPPGMFNRRNAIRAGPLVQDIREHRHRPAA
jgi:hypothetical protein